MPMVAHMTELEERTAGIRITLERAIARSTGNPLDAARDAVISVAHAIPGLSRMRATFGRRNIRPARDTFTFGVDGWSPSLHATCMTQGVDVPEGADDAARAQAIVDGMAQPLARLSMRAEEAAALGFDSPMTAARSPHVDHLHADASLIEISGRRRDLRTSAMEAVRAAHASTGASAIGATVHSINGHVIERQATRPCIREVCWPITIDGGEMPRFDGSVLSLKAPALPVTVTGAMRGRALGDLVRLHPALDGRIVNQFHVDDLGDETLYTMTFEPAHRPLRDILG